MQSDNIDKARDHLKTLWKMWWEDYFYNTRVSGGVAAGGLLSDAIKKDIYKFVETLELLDPDFNPAIEEDIKAEAHAEYTMEMAHLQEIVADELISELLDIEERRKHGRD